MRSVLVACSVVSIIGLTACQSNYSRVNEKQSTPSDIKISHLNLDDKSINLRFEYRTYSKRTLEEISCDIDFKGKSASLSINQIPDINLDAFSTEILKFNSINIINHEVLLNTDTIEYSLNCNLNYDRGSEGVYEKSVLHLIPGDNLKFR